MLVGSSIAATRTAVAKVGDTMSGTLSSYIGTSAAQQFMQQYGRNDNIRRWATILETDADLSFFSYDAAGATPVQVLRLDNPTGAMTTASTITAGGSVIANGAVSSSTTQLLVGTSAAGIIAFRANGVSSGTNQGLYDSSGNLGIGGTGTGVNWVATSDRDLKDNIEAAEADPFLADRLQFVSFDWKDTGRHDFGVIAQEV